jgi:glycogen debranching enzyme
LDDTDVTYSLPVIRNGELLNDPAHPYKGCYCGPEDTSRKAAYHNGTAWCWPFPAYCEALAITGNEKSRKRALALLMSAAIYFESGVTGLMPEVADGDAPHRPGGCLAQAWSVSEFFRVLEFLNTY